MFVVLVVENHLHHWQLMALEGSDYGYYLNDDCLDGYGYDLNGDDYLED